MPKYQSTKIPQRIKFFETVRNNVNNTENFSAEDLELIRAVASHGLVLFQPSPILQCTFKGICNEQKVYSRVKQIFDEPRRSKVVQRIPDDFQSKLPLRINDMMMLTSMGEINPKYHNEEFVYPIGYTTSVVMPSITRPTMLAWAECTIQLHHKVKDEQNKGEGDENEDEELVFIINPKPNDEVHTIVGKTPDECFEQYRSELEATAGFHITYYDGHEMFGLTTGFVHRLLLEMPRIDECTNYKHRFFSTIFPLNPRWPQIGVFEKDNEKNSQQLFMTSQATLNPNPTVLKQSSKKFKFKKRDFGELLPPLVVECSMLKSDASKRYSLDITSSPSISNSIDTSVVDAFDIWNQKDFRTFLDNK